MGGLRQRVCASARALEQVGGEWARDVLCRGDVVLLTGDVGVGKSVFARGVVRQLVGDPHHIVPSPSFLLEQEYGPVRVASPLSSRPEGSPRGTLKAMVRHFDFYRLKEFTSVEWSAFDWDRVLFQDVCLIEWPQCALDMILNAEKPKWATIWSVSITEENNQEPFSSSLSSSGSFRSKPRQLVVEKVDPFAFKGLI